MNVFVWESYGELDIYEISTEQQKELLKIELVQALRREGKTGVDESMPLGDVLRLTRCQLGNSDMFGYKTGIYKVKG